jgi:hypothetical protein
LLAVGLEQTVEYVHHRHQLHQLRRELATELQENREFLAKNSQAFRRISSMLNDDMALLRGAQQSRVPSAKSLDYSWNDTFKFADGAWESARASGTLPLLTHDEMRTYSFAYDVMNLFVSGLGALGQQLETAGAIAHRSTNGDLLPGDIQELVTATSECQAKLAFASQLLKYEERGLARIQGSMKGPLPD